MSVTLKNPPELARAVGFSHAAIGRGQIVVHLSSCITKDNYHGPPCPHLDYLRVLIGRLDIEVRDDTAISHKAEERRQAGIYKS